MDDAPSRRAELGLTLADERYCGFRVFGYSANASASLILTGVCRPTRPYRADILSYAMTREGSPVIRQYTAELRTRQWPSILRGAPEHG